ncbi:hypothetical protein ASPZODRAFT_103047 [Penicilliopsis zonata CBS 506.65]|uniref:Transmembrane protein n=1 Tax=Penicilliopsis zonata CBS 506.65 TaxID=1073090 RepID=A0A1L9S912_9EURO|nr:hypothetical protein ASPZODRAFT_103047 [Penicilliopsis zonata CBS 506.65]OJJ43650.1 hypothetical protein ASPZODRAFT_103047 [Penicilliopsis zonata CBS 506.65]
MTCSNCTNSSSTSPDLVGWVDENSGRGTLSLVTTCLFTIFLCTWVVIHPRVDANVRRATQHKLVLFVKAVLAPEFIAVEALQEWAQCRRMEEEEANHTASPAMPIQAFYISMLALRYRTVRGGDRVLWPNQYIWLLEQQLVTWAECEASWGLAEEQIRDKSKADNATKLLALAQVLWFVAECIMRPVHRLPLSQLEAMTLGYIPLFAVTYFFWWAKPKDIRTPSVVDLPPMSAEQWAVFDSMAISNKFDNEGLPEQITWKSIWYLTPRVFEKEEQDAAAIAVASSGGKSSPSSPSSSSSSRIPSSLPKQTVLSHWDPLLYRSKLIWPLTCLFGASCGALHLVAWDTVFPTAMEAWLWRVSAFVSIVSMLVFMHFEKVILRWGGPLTILSLVSPALYLLSRLVMMVEVFVALRAEELAIHDTYQVSTYWVHLL